MSDKNLNTINEIKDIIFGNEKKDFEVQLMQLKDALKAIEDEIEKSFDASDMKLQKKSERAFSILETKISNISIFVENERIKLKELIDNLDINFQKELANQKEAFDAQLKMLKKQIAHDNEKMQESLNVMQHEIQLTFEKNLIELSNDKLSRDSIGQNFLDIVTKIQR